MAALNGQLAASGLAGAITSLVVSSTSSFFADGNLKGIIAVAGGMFASVVTFEIMAWFVVIRLSQQRRMMNALIPNLESLQKTISGGITTQMNYIRDHDGPKKIIADLDKSVSESAADIAKTLLEIQRANLEIVRNINR